LFLFGFCVLSGSAVTSPDLSVTAAEDVQSSAASLNESVETGSDDDGEDAWEQQTYETDKEKFDTIADKQPGHITHNPW
jgi:hypothetical protein